MHDIFSYLTTYGDIPFSSSSVNPADSLIFSLLAYIRFDFSYTDKMKLSEAISSFLKLSDINERIRVKRDIKFLKTLASAKRFCDLELAYFCENINYLKETQFGAVSFILDNKTAFVAFRGTDTALTSWKEDFNMSFKDYVPAQKEAAIYLNKIAPKLPESLILGGHSKGGNIAVFAAVKCESSIRKRIVSIYNNDGPGFSEYITEDSAYMELIPKINTYIPEASIVGMLLEHKGSYSVIRSHNIGIIQHEPYSWKIVDGDFEYLEKLSHETEIMSGTIKSWLQKMPRKERKEFVDAVFDILESSNATSTQELITPKNIHTLITTLKTDTKRKNIVIKGLSKLFRSVISTIRK